MIDNKGHENRLLQIQPVHSQRDSWQQLAESEGLSMEVLELSMPPALNESGLSNEIIKWYRACGRAVSVHGCFIDVNPASGDILYRELSEKRCRQSCDVAKRLGAKNIVFHSSCFPFLRGPFLEGWAAFSAVLYENLVNEYDLNIFIENSMDIDTAPLVTLMEITKNDRIRVCLDLGHANYSHTPLEKWFDDLGDNISYLHLSDNKGEFDDHMTLGTGTIDWDKADALYRSLGKEVPMTLEVGSIDSVRKSIGFLRQNGYFGIK